MIEQPAGQDLLHPRLSVDLEVARRIRGEPAPHSPKVFIVVTEEGNERVGDVQPVTGHGEELELRVGLYGHYGRSIVTLEDPKGIAGMIPPILVLGAVRQDSLIVPRLLLGPRLAGRVYEVHPRRGVIDLVEQFVRIVGSPGADLMGAVQHPVGAGLGGRSHDHVARASPRLDLVLGPRVPGKIGRNFTARSGPQDDGKGEGEGHEERWVGLADDADGRGKQAREDGALLGEGREAAFAATLGGGS
mmetsp:Transcript_9976/g.29539  ORF Transcript_9976/g.29539 Transcript_9976/m.29539 type:complete len:246 (+) Transcript_9976:728-1465(+)